MASIRLCIWNNSGSLHYSFTVDRTAMGRMPEETVDDLLRAIDRELRLLYRPGDTIEIDGCAVESVDTAEEPLRAYATRAVGG
jgi:sensor domain CHASE-containing protein